MISGRLIILTLLSVLPILSFGQLKNYLPLMSAHAGITTSLESSRRDGSIRNIRPGIGNNNRLYFGFNVLRFLDTEIGLGNTYKSYRDINPDCDTNGFCPDVVRYKYSFINLDFSGKLRVFFVQYDFGESIVYPYVRMGSSLHITRRQNNVGTLNFVSDEYPGDEFRAITGFANYAVGAELLNRNNFMYNMGLSYSKAQTLFQNSKDGLLAIGVEVGIAYWFEKLN